MNPIDRLKLRQWSLELASATVSESVEAKSLVARADIFFKFVAEEE